MRSIAVLSSLGVKKIRRNAIPRLLRDDGWLLRAVRHEIAGSRRIAVLGGHGGQGFDDNSRAMALHLHRDPGYKVFWIGVNPATLSSARKAGIKPLKRGSALADLVVATAHEAYYSHGFNDLTTSAYARLPWRTITYLGHGVWGFKRIERRKNSEQPKLFDLTLCVSEQERDLKSGVLNVARDRILPTGLPKHDTLHHVTGPEKNGRRSVLYAPTWRDWLQHKPSDLAIAKHFDALETLVRAMPTHDHEGNEIALTYAVHKNIRDLSRQASEICQNFGVKCVETSRVDVNALLRRTDYLISDYSAMFWDFIVQGKPAVRYVFDRTFYDALTGSYGEIDAKAADVTFEDVGAAWAALFAPGAAERSRAIARDVIPFSDGRSCEKISLAISALAARDQTVIPHR